MQQTLHTCGHLPGPLVCHHALSAGRRLRASRPASRARRRCRDAHCGARSDAAEPQSDPEAERLFQQGFIQFRLSGEPLRLGVDDLNERLKVRGAQRMRQAFRPDEAHAMLFNFDGVIADTRELQREAWRRVAAEEGLPFPQTERQLYDLRPERAITEVLQWTREWGVAQRLAWRVAAVYSELFHTLSEPRPGVREWLAALQRASVPCALVTSFDRTAVRAALERMGLRGFFRAEVTAEDGMETLAQRLLSAAIKLGRPPDHCVVFETSPVGVCAAHNCTMKAVAVQGAHPAYRLKQADLTCSSLADLSIINVRRLFAVRDAEFMALKQQGAERPPRFRRTTNAVFE